MGVFVFFFQPTKGDCHDYNNHNNPGEEHGNKSIPLQLNLR